MFEIGSSLREARTRQGLDFEEMEVRTKIRAKYLRHLEEERFDQLPGHTYTKGFLRVYANGLGLDGGLYVDEYNSRFVGVEDELQPRLPRSRPPEPRRRRQSRESRTVGIALVAIVVTTALVIVAWRFGGPDAPQVQGVNATPQVTRGPLRTVPIKISVRAAKGSSFLEVRTGKRLGQALYLGTLERGDVQVFRGKILYLAIEKPGNVILSQNGRRVSIPRAGELTLGGQASAR
ncbi:MAG: helix-turn-helix domain-containing protein [Gaiella sp.]